MTPGAFPMLPRPKVIASFWRLPERGWVFQSAALDAVTVANENQRHRLTSQPGRQPWVETLRLFDGRRPFAFTERLLPSDFNPYVFVPGPLTEHEDPELPLRLAIQVLPTRPHWHFVIGGQMDDLGFKKAREWWNQLGAHGIVDRLFFTGPVEVMQITDLIKEADVLLTASLKLESFQTSLALQAGHTYARPIVMNTAQATYDSYTWDHEHSACVCSRPFSEMTAQLELVMDNQVMRQRLHENLLRTSHEMTDHAVNVLSRLYLATGPASI